MSKKLIAVAAASALALSALVAAPANAALSAGISMATGGSGTTAAPYTIGVVSTNIVDEGVTALKLTITDVATGDAIRVTTTGAAKVIDEEVTSVSKFVKVSSLGTAAYTDTTTSDDDVVLYVFTTDTNAATVATSVTRTGLSYNTSATIKGVAGLKYNIVNVTGVPAILAKDATADVTFEITDSLGNKVESVSGLSATNFGSIAWSTTKKVYETKLTSPSTTPFILTIDIGATDVVGLADAADTYSTVVNFAGSTALTTQVAALTAQLAASRPIADSVTKKRFNTLARKWNAAFPSQKVALKK